MGCTDYGDGVYVGPTSEQRMARAVAAQAALAGALRDKEHREIAMDLFGRMRKEHPQERFTFEELQGALFNLVSANRAVIGRDLLVYRR